MLRPTPRHRHATTLEPGSPGPEGGDDFRRDEDVAAPVSGAAEPE